MLSWDQPQWLGMEVLLVPMILLLIRAWRRLRERRTRFAEPELLSRMAVRLPEAEDAARLLALLGAFALVGLAAAGPRWGGRLGDRVPGEVPTLMVACDVSASMGCQDVSPTRYDQGRDVLIHALPDLSGWNVGLIAFADEALVFCPITSDRSAATVLTARLSPGMPELHPGTNCELALRKAMDQLHGRSGAILLLTDGESLAGDPGSVVQRAARAHVPIYGLMVGTESGARVPHGTDLFGQPQYRLDRDGNQVISKAHPEVLRACAVSTGGEVLDAAAPGAAARLLASLEKRYRPHEAQAPGRTLYQLPLLGALLLLLARGFRSVPAFKTYLAIARIMRRLRAATTLGLIFLSLSQLAWTWPWQSAAGEAARAYSQGDWQASRKSLGRARAERPDDPLLAYDEGCARYQSGDYEGALKAFGQARDRAPKGSRLRTWAYYNLGNTCFRLGERTVAHKERWTEALGAYDQALKRDSKDADARYNRDLVSRRLQELKDDRRPSRGAGARPSKGSASAPAPSGPSPAEAEIQALLDALEHEEAKHQAAVHPAPPPPPDASATDLFKQLIDQATDPRARADRPDW